MRNEDLTEQKCSQECLDINSKSSNHKTCLNFTFELVQEKYPYCDLQIERSVKRQRWKSKPFKIYSSSCQDTKEDFDSCYLENYTIGEYLNKTNPIKEYARFLTGICEQYCKLEPK